MEKLLIHLLVIDIGVCHVKVESQQTTVMSFFNPKPSHNHFVKHVDTHLASLHQPPTSRLRDFAGPITCLTSVTVTFSTTDAGNLEDLLKTGYYTSVRPKNQTDVGLIYGLLHISSLDIVSQQIDLVGFVILIWEDSRLQWVPSDYGDMFYTMMLLTDIWVPPIVLNNAAGGLKILHDDEDIASTYANIYENGFVSVVIPTHFISQCIVNIKYYPFDSQNCHIILTPWSFVAEEVNLFSLDESVVMDLYEENGEWDITDISVTNYSRPVGDSTLSATKISLKLQRKYSYYLINLILPVILLAILGTFVFILPVESGEKNGFSLTILLSMSVMMTIVSDRIPPIATQTCQLSIYLLIVFMICSLETAVTVISCQVHAYTAKGYVPGKRLQKLATVMATICRYRRHKVPIRAISQLSNSNGGSGPGMVKYRIRVADDKSITWDDEVKTEVSQLDKQISYTYEEIAFILDRFNFIIFFFVTVSITIAFFVMITAADFSYIHSPSARDYKTIPLNSPNITWRRDVLPVCISVRSLHLQVGFHPCEFSHANSRASLFSDSSCFFLYLNCWHGIDEQMC